MQHTNRITYRNRDVDVLHKRFQIGINCYDSEQHYTTITNNKCSISTPRSEISTKNNVLNMVQPIPFCFRFYLLKKNPLKNTYVRSATKLLRRTSNAPKNWKLPVLIKVRSLFGKTIGQYQAYVNTIYGAQRNTILTQSVNYLPKGNTEKENTNTPTEQTARGTAVTTVP